MKYIYIVFISSTEVVQKFKLRSIIVVKNWVRKNWVEIWLKHVEMYIQKFYKNKQDKFISIYFLNLSEYFSFWFMREVNVLDEG
jgi:hypothetical protein